MADEPGSEVLRSDQSILDHSLMPYLRVMRYRDSLVKQMMAGIETVRDDRLELLRAEVARLREGESPEPPAEGIQPTPAQLIHLWNAQPERRLDRARQILDNADAAGRCLLEDHRGAIAEVQHWVSTVIDLVELIRDLADPAPCDQFDHHGHCQTHGWTKDGVCPHARARDVLTAQEAGGDHG